MSHFTNTGSDQPLDELVDDVLMDPYGPNAGGVNLSAYFRAKQRAQQATSHTVEKPVEVSPSPEPASPQKQTPAERQADFKLQLRVVKILSSHDRGYRQIRVEVTRKVAILAGVVATADQRDTAMKLAGCVAGIDRVDSQIAIDPQAVRAREQRRQEQHRLQRQKWGMAVALTVVVLGWRCAAMRGDAQPSDRLPVVPLQGQLTIDDTVPSGAMLIFHRRDPAEAAHPTPTAIVRGDGSYRVTTYETGDGAPLGDYTVTIFWQPAINDDGRPLTASSLPEEYASAKSSPLKTTITETTMLLPPMQVKTKL